MPYLIQKQANGTMARQWQLGDTALVFGRGKEADVIIDDPEMSKRHFQIERQGEAYLIRDLKSSNGTWIQKQPVIEVELKAGDKIRAGQTLFVFEKGLSTIIGELSQEKRSYETMLKEIVKSTGPRRARTEQMPGDKR